MMDDFDQPVRAGRANNVLSRFETAVFLIGAGLREKDASYENDPHKYPYSENFRHGLNIFAALCAECAKDNATGILSGLNESGFIRDYCTKDVCEWVDGWDEGSRAQILGGAYAALGPLAEVEDGFFTPTSECFELTTHAENDTLGAYQERKVYEFLRAGSQGQYVFGRRLLARHPVLSWDVYTKMKTGRYDFSSDPLDQGEAKDVDQDWLMTLLDMAYESAPDGMKRCPHCGWTMGQRGRQPYCVFLECADGLPANFSKLDDVEHGSVRLSRGVMHYISAPGNLEIAIAETACELGLGFEMWPLKDTCDLLITLPGGKRLAIDAKAYGNAAKLAREIRDDNLIGRVDADEFVYVIPNEAEKRHPGFCVECQRALSSKSGYDCVTFKELRHRLTKVKKEVR